MEKYRWMVYWSENEQKWLANIPDLPTCTADGQTPAEALANVEKEVILWLKSLGNLEMEKLH